MTKSSPSSEDNPVKRLNLPLIGKQPVSFQYQILAVLSGIFLVLTGYIAVKDSRTSAYRAAHLGLSGEIGVLTERIARLAPAAAGNPQAVKELTDAMARENAVFALLDQGGDVDGKPIPGADNTLRANLDATRGRWDAFSNEVKALSVAIPAPVPVPAPIPAPAPAPAPAAPSPSDSALPPTPVAPQPEPVAIDRLAKMNQRYLLLRDATAQLSRDASDALSERDLTRALLAAFGSLAMLMLGLWFMVFNDDAAARQALLARQKREAEEQQQKAEAANAETQQAIGQLMDEMTNLADGDLTARASVSDNITGTIADAMNYAIEELAVLVKRINDASGRVATASATAAKTSEELLSASETQSQEIRRASGQVLSMAQSMNEVSGNAGQSAGVARQSLEVAKKGAAAVADSISGMDGIRGQIQETSKRIKRLGESSQEIGEIVELITDITDQTNVLALNAAIQAASAGEAGRGFTVVAEEVQHLAERSADATRRIAALVKTIQADTQQAVSAMENSTQGVIEGARLSDAAGQALANISTVSKELDQMIAGISSDTLKQAEVAKNVAQAMREILRVTEQTSSGTRSTAMSISEIADLAVELKGSVAGFKV